MLKFISKMEAHKIIDMVPGNVVMLIQYDETIGISGFGERIKKKKGKKYIDKSALVTLSQENPITILNLYEKYFCDFSAYRGNNKMKSILLPKLE